jgi:hypothetical protein
LSAAAGERRIGELGLPETALVAILRRAPMNDEVVLTLHCPQCKEITEVVTEGDDLVCLDCGWKFDEKVAARVLQGASGEQATR